MKGCQRCEFNEHSCALDLHHRDPKTKKFEVTQNMTRSWAKIKAELAKCDVLCANCHRIVEHI